MKDVHDLEIYSPIDGFPNYLVTNHGRIISLNYRKGEKIKELKQKKNTRGYLHVRLFKNDRGYNKTIHRLVAQAFIPNPNNKSCVNHIDENKTNNCVSNLEWVTHKENNNYGTRNERASKSRYKKIIAKSVNKSKVLIFKSVTQAEKYGFDSGNISKCCRGKLKTYKCYTWEHINNKNEDSK